MDDSPSHRLSCFFLVWIVLFLLFSNGAVAGKMNFGRPKNRSLCASVVRPFGYSCAEHTVETQDGFLLALQQIQGRNVVRSEPGLPVFLQHGLFQGGDTWFANSVEESLGFVLADAGFDVWVGSVRGTFWSHGHISLHEKDKDFWDWSWQDLAAYDLRAMISYVYTMTDSKVFYVGHSQGTIMALAAFTEPEIVDMVSAASLLCPISYLGHVTSPFVLRAVTMHLDQIVLNMGLHQLNFRSNLGVRLLESICDGHMDCSDLLSVITGKNCCFNNTRVDHYLEYEPHPSSVKNLRHLFQMIRKGTFSKFDYGFWGNLKRYGTPRPPAFDLSQIPKSLPIWMGYGGLDGLSDITDLKRTLDELRPEPELLFLESYGHIDFILSTTARTDVYDQVIDFFRSLGRRASY